MRAIQGYLCGAATTDLLQIPVPVAGGLGLLRGGGGSRDSSGMCVTTLVTSLLRSYRASQNLVRPFVRANLSSEFRLFRLWKCTLLRLENETSHPLLNLFFVVSFHLLDHMSPTLYSIHDPRCPWYALLHCSGQFPRCHNNKLIGASLVATQKFISTGTPFHVGSQWLPSPPRAASRGSALPVVRRPGGWIPYCFACGDAAVMVTAGLPPLERSLSKRMGETEWGMNLD